MSVTHVIGIDPGLVHSGGVYLGFDSTLRTIWVEAKIVDGPDVAAIAANVADWAKGTPDVFIEKYQPRSHFAGDSKMMEAQGQLKAELPHAKIILNTGVKKIVRQPLMELLGVWRFTTPSHHQDLRSAARIALYGMLKDEQLNTLVADIVRDHLEGRTWNVRL